MLHDTLTFFLANLILHCHRFSIASAAVKCEYLREKSKIICGEITCPTAKSEFPYFVTLPKGNYRIGVPDNFFDIVMKNIDLSNKNNRFANVQGNVASLLSVNMTNDLVDVAKNAISSFSGFLMLPLYKSVVDTAYYTPGWWNYEANPEEDSCVGMHGLYMPFLTEKYSESITVTEHSCFIRILVNLFTQQPTPFEFFMHKKCDYASCVATACHGGVKLPNVYVAEILAKD